MPIVYLRRRRYICTS